MREPLLEVDSAFGAGGCDHGLAVKTVNPESGMARNIILEIFDPVRRKPLRTVDGEHAPSGAAAESGVFEVMVEHGDISGPGFQRNPRKKVFASDSPVALGLPDLFLDGLREAIVQDMASGDDAQAAGVPGNGIEVEGDFDKTNGFAPTVGMPDGIAGVVVAVGTDVVVIGAE